MLSEIFSFLELDDGSQEDLPLCRPEEFRPLIQMKNWFLQHQTSETLFHRACYAYHVGDYHSAYRLFKEELIEGEHNRVHKVGLYESIVRSGLKIEPLPDDIEDMLYAYKNIASEYGEQLQYWNSAVLVIKNAGPNYELAYLTRILTLLECNLEYAAGFAANQMIQVIKKTKAEISDLKVSEEKVKLSKTQMVTDLLRTDKLRELGNDVKRPAHECRCKIGVFKTNEQIHLIYKEFTARYKWMFAGMSL